MSGEEMEDLFSTLYNNIRSNLAPGLDSYEISLFLTKAQDELVKAYFNPVTNKTLQGFDGNERRLLDFSKLIDTVQITNSGNVQNAIATMFGIRTGVYYFNTDTDSKRIMMILNESVKVGNNYYTVIPLKYTDLPLLMTKPYKRPIKGLAWRIINKGESKDTDNDNHIDSTSLSMEVITHPGDTGNATYIIRYVRRPLAIRTTTFDSDVTIDGGYTAQDCELDPMLHEEIVLRAVELAKASYGGGNDLLAMLLAGNLSATEKGILTKLS